MEDDNLLIPGDMTEDQLEDAVSNCAVEIWNLHHLCEDPELEELYNDAIAAVERLGEKLHDIYFG